MKTDSVNEISFFDDDSDDDNFGIDETANPKTSSKPQTKNSKKEVIEKPAETKTDEYNLVRALFVNELPSIHKKIDETYKHNYFERRPTIDHVTIAWNDGYFLNNYGDDAFLIIFPQFINKDNLEKLYKEFFQKNLDIDEYDTGEYLWNMFGEGSYKDFPGLDPMIAGILQMKDSSYDYMGEKILERCSDIVMEKTLKIKDVEYLIQHISEILVNKYIDNLDEFCYPLETHFSNFTETITIHNDGGKLRFMMLG